MKIRVISGQPLLDNVAAGIEHIVEEARKKHSRMEVISLKACSFSLTTSRSQQRSHIILLIPPGGEIRVGISNLKVSPYLKNA